MLLLVLIQYCVVTPEEGRQVGYSKYSLWSLWKYGKVLHDRYGVEFIVVDLNYPITDEEILSKFERVFVEEKPKLCMFDTISSMPGVIFLMKNDKAL